jgi:hypothetical protein
MITTSDVTAYLHCQPFERFDIRMSDGRVYTVDHPEFLHISRKGNVIYYSTDDDRLVTIAVSQITTLEKVNAPRAA